MRFEPVRVMGLPEGSGRVLSDDGEAYVLLKLVPEPPPPWWDAFFQEARSKDDRLNLNGVGGFILLSDTRADQLQEHVVRVCALVDAANVRFRELNATRIGAQLRLDEAISRLQFPDGHGEGEMEG